MTERTALVSGYIRAVSDANNPTQTRLSIILTDFEPNKNKQAIPRSEAENILRTALIAPLKINFDGKGYAGHKGAFPIGAIANASMSQDNGRDVISGDAVVWNDMFPEVSDHLKKAFASGIGTSWEIYFKDSKTDDDGVEWLEGCVFAGTAIVDVPAYGPNRTRVLAIAETLHDHAEHLMEMTNMSKETETEVITPETEVTNVDAPAVAEDDVNTVRGDLQSLMTLLSDMYSGLYTMYDETDEIEASLTTTDMPSLASQFSKLVASVTKRFDALKEKAATAETVEAELTTIKEALAQAEVAKAEAEKLEARKTALAAVGIELTDEKKEFYITMPDAIFDVYVADIGAALTKAVAETRTNTVIKVPEPNGNGTSNYTSKELAGFILADLNK